MNWVKVLLIVLFAGLAQAGNAQRFSQDPNEFSKQAEVLIQSYKTEAAYQISGKFTSCWSSSWTEPQKLKIHSIAQNMGRRGHTNDTYFNFFAFLTFAITQESMSQAEMTKLLDVTEAVLKERTRPEFAKFANSMNFFLAKRYLAFTRTIQSQAKGGSYEFKVLDNNPNLYLAGDGSLVKLDSIAAGDAFGGYQADETDAYVDPWKEDKYAGQTAKPADDPWATPVDDPWATPADDPWATPAADNDPWAATAFADPWSNNEGIDPWAAKASKKLQRPKVDPPIVHDYVADMRARYFFPPINGPVIELKKINVLMNTPYDSMTIAGVDGNFLLAKGIFAGNGGKLKWPEAHDKMDGATVELGEWHFEADRDYFWTPNAKLTYAKFSDAPIEGRFEFKSMPRAPGKLSSYPIFQSNNVGLKLDLSEKAKYTGGLEVRGSEFRGKAISRELGKLELIGAKGNRVYINSAEFVLGDSAMTAETGELILIHGSDTIYHPAVQIWYNVATEELIALRNKNRSVSPFRSSYFGVEINVDLLKWNMAKDSIIFDVLNGKEEIPMTVESDKYFTPDRFRKLNSLFPTHPVVMVVHFSRKYGNITTFYDQELAVEYKESVETVRGILKLLEMYGFITYNRTLGEVNVLPKAFHYFDASAKKVDYDYVYMASYKNDQPNAIVLLDSGQMVVNGVTSFSVVEGYELEVETDSSKQVTLLKDRGFRLNGTVTEGDFIYHGRNFEFNYDQFFIFMPVIDSMRLNVPLHDSTNVDAPPQRTELSNQITGTSGTLYIEEPHHKAGHEENDAYPYFVTDSEAIVYFSGREILGGAYDRSVYFVLPPFEVDSLDRSSGESFAFEGKFISGGIFPDFDETLSIQPDRSLGFTHEIPATGYNLYGTEARTYETIRLSNKGIRGRGQIDFLTTQIFSDDFIYYPDSVTTDGTGGRIKPGDYKGASFPEAILGKYDMRWLPRKDSMYLRTVTEPFKFYNSSAELTGFANITTKGVYGGGMLKTRGSRTQSKEMSFKEKKYAARHARFEIETADPKKPAMAANDISIDFDLVQNIAVLRPEKVGKAAFSFPYAQMKTSITEAVWDLDKEIVTMTKPADVPLKDSYFYSTRKELDSLVFSGERATYDMKTNSITVEGIPYITVADSRIIPEGNRTTILENSQLQEFKNAEIVIDTLNGFHRLTRGKITVVSRNKFEGSAFYQVGVGSDTFEIRFDTFFLREVPLGKKNTRLMTVSGGEVLDTQNLKIAPGFFYKGSVEMFAYKQALELSGSVRMDVQNIPNANTLWIPYTRTDSAVNPHIPLINAKFDDGSQAIAGIFNDSKGELYSAFIEKRKDPSDLNIFNAQGELSYDATSGTYKVETPSKSAGGRAGHTIQYDDITSNLLIEGPITFLKPTTTDIQINTAVIGNGNKLTNEFTLDCFMAMNYVVIDLIIDEMGKDIVSALERIGANTANDPTEELLKKLANLIGDQGAHKYNESMVDGYKSVVSMSKELEKSMVISGVKMKWNPAFKAWHNTTKLGLSNIGRMDVNARVDGFLEIKRDDSNEDVMNLFIQISPETWYYISYNKHNLLMYSSNPTFNELVKSKSNLGKQKAGQLVFVVGDVNETLGFINSFRKNYFGIDTPYNLSFPSDSKLEDENFETIKKDDDGFGF